MPPLTLTSRILLALLCAATLAAGVAFHRRQKRAALGGEISRAKAAWLTFAVLFWLGVCPVLAWDPALPQPFRGTFGLFAASFWVRALAELYMLYVTKSWRPPYGVAHDIACIGLVCGSLVLLPRSAPGSAWDTMGLLASVALLVSLVAETYYALAFHELVAGQTVGSEGVWFADQESEKFRRINRLTATLNVPLYLFLGALVAAAFGLFS